MLNYEINIENDEVTVSDGLKNFVFDIDKDELKEDLRDIVFEAITNGDFEDETVDGYVSKLYDCFMNTAATY